MTDTDERSVVGDLLRRLAAVLMAASGITAVVDPASVSAAAVVVAIAAVLIAAALAGADVFGAAAARFHGAPRAIDPSALVAQSDPDAAGHSRPRAPGSVAAA